MNSLPKGRDVLENNLWKQHAELRFPPEFYNYCPENAQKLIIWCLQHDPEERPSVDEILKSGLIPELENHDEVLRSLFNRQTASVSSEIDITWDTDAAARVRGLFPERGKNTLMNTFIRNLRDIGGPTLKDPSNVHSSAMNHLAMFGAITTLKRARHVRKIRGAPQLTASVLAMSAATSNACTGMADGFLPRLTESICDQLKTIFEAHGAVKLRAPLLRPKGRLDSGRDGPVELMNERGIILTLPEDLTATFARNIGRTGGIGVKRYEIDRTFHKSKIGGHPIESLEAAFDIILEGANTKSHVFESEIIILICQAMQSFVHKLSRKFLYTQSF